MRHKLRYSILTVILIVMWPVVGLSQLSGGAQGEEDLLRSCYLESLERALEKDVRSIAFPAISTGVYRFPKDRACRIATGATIDWSNEKGWPMSVTFCCFSEEDAAIYRSLLSARG